jgi:AAA domain
MSLTDWLNAAESADEPGAAQPDTKWETVNTNRDSVLDKFSNVAKWSDILKPLGWTEAKVQDTDTLEAWKRPGGTDPISAKVPQVAPGTIVVWSTDAGLPAGPGQKLNKAKVYAHLYYGGDLSAASKALVRGEAVGLPTVVVAACKTEMQDQFAGLMSPPNSDRQHDQHATEGENTLEVDVANAAYRLKVQDLARRKNAEENAGVIALPTAYALDEFLAQPEEETKYLIDGIWPKSGKVLLAAQYKAGKSTLRDNAVRCLADGGLFLGKFDTEVVTDTTVVVIDLELSQGMMRRWLRDQGIENQSRIKVIPMRGQAHSLNLTLPEVRARWAKYVINLGAAVVILDCMRPILDALNLSEDKDASKFLTGFDAMTAEADVQDTMVIHHMGHTGERARGDSGILGWGDALWKMVRKDDDPASQRYFSAFGRDVEVPESELTYNPITRALTITGGSRKHTAAERALYVIGKHLKENPGLSQSAVIKAFGRGQDKYEVVPERTVRAAIKLGFDHGELRSEEHGVGEAMKLHWSGSGLAEASTNAEQP